MTLYGTVSRGGRPDSYTFPPLPVERLKRLGARSLIFVSFEENGASVEARPGCTWSVRAHGIFLEFHRGLSSQLLFQSRALRITRRGSRAEVGCIIHDLGRGDASGKGNRGPCRRRLPRTLELLSRRVDVRRCPSTSNSTLYTCRSA